MDIFLPFKNVLLLKAKVCHRQLHLATFGDKDNGYSPNTYEGYYRHIHHSEKNAMPSCKKFKKFLEYFLQFLSNLVYKMGKLLKLQV